MISILYYAHSMTIYDTEREQEELKTLGLTFWYYVIFNPNSTAIQLHANPMLACFDVIRDPYVQGLAFSCSQPGFVSCGVYAEIRCAQKRGLPIYYILGDSVYVYKGGFELVKEDKATKWARVNASHDGRNINL